MRLGPRPRDRRRRARRRTAPRDRGEAHGDPRRARRRQQLGRHGRRRRPATFKRLDAAEHRPRQRRADGGDPGRPRRARLLHRRSASWSARATTSTSTTRSPRTTAATSTSRGRASPTSSRSTSRRARSSGATQVDGYRSDHMAISPDGTRLLVSASTARKVHVIDTATAGSSAVRVRRPAAREQLLARRQADLPRSIGTVYTPLDDPLLDATKGDRWFQVVDAQHLKVLKRIDMGEKLEEAGYPNMSSAVRPMALAPDERFVYLQLSFLHGFVEYDLQSRQVAADRRAAAQRGGEEAPARGVPAGLGAPRPGDEPAGTKLCVAGTMSDYAAIVRRATFAYTLAAVGEKPYWATNSADGQLLLRLGQRRRPRRGDLVRDGAGGRQHPGRRPPAADAHGQDPPPQLAAR